MSTTVWGIVKEGCIVPSSPLPEGAHVEIRLAEPTAKLPEALRAEFEAWERAGGHTRERVESVVREDEGDIPVDVTILAPATPAAGGSAMAAAMAALATNGGPSGFGDPAEWQREARAERDLPGRDE